MNQTSGTQAFPYQQPVGQVPPGQFQPLFVQAQASPGQYVQQPVGQVGQPQVQPVQPAAAPAVPKTTAYWQSALIAERVVEFLFLSAAWISIVRYTNGYEITNGRVNFFKGITVFCWIESIVFQIGFVFGFNHIKCLFSQPSLLTTIDYNCNDIENDDNDYDYDYDDDDYYHDDDDNDDDDVNGDDDNDDDDNDDCECFIVHIVLTILLVACTVTLVFHAHEVSKMYDFLPLLIRTNLDELYLALIFGFLACFSFFETVRLFFKMIVTQRGEEAPDNSAQTAQELGTQPSTIQPKTEI
ncbi:hypothetical protein AWC38_SpisGene2045 [Stylophora pistillata]|uniref:Uncharacterized protein n=1 Tax=Stylophora pistillata TaxID=50429 RepID=A0A2B4SXE2_STYPI|nr:hypothetical protein AWC38_SpisGene2045 [Stylophora pistillata]